MVTASGTLPWQANGALVCNAAGSQENPAIASDGSGGAIIAWADKRTDNSGDLYASRINNGGVLPLVLLDFGGTNNTLGNTIRWTADREQAGLSYQLEVSTNGITFAPLYTQQARNLSGRQQYTYQHTNAGTLQYYRLRLQQPGGKIWYSHVVVLGAKQQASFTVYPTLAHDRVNINIAGSASGEVLVMNTDGRPVMRLNVQNPGILQLNIGHLSAGTYFCTFQGRQARFVKY